MTINKGANEILAGVSIRFRRSIVAMIFNIYVFIWLHQVLVAACRIFNLHCSVQDLRCSLWDLVPWPGITPGPPANLGAKCLSHGTPPGRSLPHSFRQSAWFIVDFPPPLKLLKQMNEWCWLSLWSSLLRSYCVPGTQSLYKHQLI